ncbi:hypothetical protein AB1Y20_004244 [Prymnesium parvum]|uniref:Uncharacterized protein n=1 Tax=Prymnesium parvum TaxID=97485 RepID=A0AB34J662_PRYPA
MSSCDLGPHLSIAKQWDTGALVQVTFDGWEDGRELLLSFEGQALTVDPRSLAHATLQRAVAVDAAGSTLLALRLLPLEYQHLCYTQGCAGPSLSFATRPPPLNASSHPPTFRCSAARPPAPPPPPPPPRAPPPPPRRPPRVPPRPPRAPPRPPPPPRPSPPPPAFLWPAPPPRRTPPQPPHHRTAPPPHRTAPPPAALLLLLLLLLSLGGLLRLRQRRAAAAAAADGGGAEDETCERRQLTREEAGERSWQVRVELGAEEVCLRVGKRRVRGAAALRRAGAAACGAAAPHHAVARWGEARGAVPMQIQYVDEDGEEAVLRTLTASTPFAEVRKAPRLHVMPT